MLTFFLIKQIVFPSHPHIACAGACAASVSSSVAVAAAGGFIGGVLLTAVIGVVVAVAVFCRVKRELTAATSYRLVYMLHACMSGQEMRMCNICTHGTLMGVYTDMNLCVHKCIMHALLHKPSTQSFMIL